MDGAANPGSRSTSRTNKYWQPGSAVERKITCGSARPAGENRAPSRSASEPKAAGGPAAVVMTCTVAAAKPSSQAAQQARGISLVTVDLPAGGPGHNGDGFAFDVNPEAVVIDSHGHDLADVDHADLDPLGADHDLAPLLHRDRLGRRGRAWHRPVGEDSRNRFGWPANIWLRSGPGQVFGDVIALSPPAACCHLDLRIT